MKGRKFERLLVLEDFVKGKRSFTKCLCDCGANKEVRASHLISKQTRSCGCLKSEMTSKRTSLPSGTASFNQLFTSYKRGAMRRSYIFELTKEEFKNLTSSNCFYCGIPPERVHIGKGSYSPYVCNGVDRVDNSKGYIIENCVPCCKNCNIAKSTMGKSEFLDWVERVYKYNNK